MTLIQQITPFTCGLACIESLLFDLGQPITQADMLKKYKSLLKANITQIEHFGATTPDVMARILRDQNCLVELVQINSPTTLTERLVANSNCLMVATVSPGNTHCFRFICQDDQFFQLMDPGFNQPSATIHQISIVTVANWSPFCLFVQQAIDQ